MQFRGQHPPAFLQPRKVTNDHEMPTREPRTKPIAQIDPRSMGILPMSFTTGTSRPRARCPCHMGHTHSTRQPISGRDTPCVAVFFPQASRLQSSNQDPDTLPLVKMSVSNIRHGKNLLPKELTPQPPMTRIARIEPRSMGVIVTKPSSAMVLLKEAEAICILSGRA